MRGFLIDLEATTVAFPSPSCLDPGSVATPIAPLPQALRSLIDRSPPRTIATGCSLVEPGAASAPLWYVHAGLLRRYALAADGDAYNLGFHGPGDLVAARLVLDRTGICCTDQAIGVDGLLPSRVSAVDPAQLQAWMSRDAELSNWIIGHLLAAQSEAIRRQVDQIQRSATERYVELLAKHPGLLEQVPLQQVAAWLGITPVALSRIRRRLTASTAGHH
jgi:CRP-like cAMP-binding protein